MRSIEIKIKLHAPTGGKILNDLSVLIERYLKRKKIDFSRIDVMVKFDENE